MLIPGIAWGGFVDLDGHLVISWQPPDFGDAVDHYAWSYNINGVTDSVTGTSFAGELIENSVTLIGTGHWAVFNIWAVTASGDSSVVAASDTAVYSLSVDVTDPGDDPTLPTGFDLTVYPNPVSDGEFQLKWNLAQSGSYKVDIYDILGRRVSAGRSERMEAGEYTQQIGANFSSGVYFAVISGTDDRRVVKFSIVR